VALEALAAPVMTVDPVQVRRQLLVILDHPVTWDHKVLLESLDRLAWAEHRAHQAPKVLQARPAHLEAPDSPVKLDSRERLANLVKRAFVRNIVQSTVACFSKMAQCIEHRKLLFII